MSQDGGRFAEESGDLRHSDAGGYSSYSSGVPRQRSASVPPQQPSWLSRFFGLGPHKPWVTITLVIACVLVALVERVHSQIGGWMVFAPLVGDAEPWRFLTSAFLHAGPWHLLLNMYALWLIGSALEPAIGRLRFLAIYLLSAVAGNVTVLLAADPLGQTWITATVGASGAVFGVFGALFVLYRHFGVDTTMILVTIGLNLVLTFMPGMNISWQSHLGGIITGAAMMALMLPHRRDWTRRKRSVRDVAVIVGTALVLLVLVVWKYHGL
ncbi:rhomboid family intramembrane serine protease [Actinobaculum sp. 352]|nr:rhomboid family intramembrane serine protease [Actinobaculum sp. 352]